MTDILNQLSKKTDLGDQTELPDHNEQTMEELIRNIFVSSDSDDWDPRDKIPLVTKEIEKLKTELRTFLGESDFDIVSIYKESQALCEEGKQLIEEMESCKNYIEQETMAEIFKSIENHNSISNELERVNYTLNIICDIVTCGKYANEFGNFKRLQNFSRDVEIVTDLLELLNNPTDGYSSLLIYENIKTTAVLFSEELKNNLLGQWDLLFNYTSKPDSRVNANGARISNIVTLNMKLDDSHKCVDVLKALNIYNLLPKRVTEFSKFLLKEVLIPIIHQVVTIVCETDELITLTIYSRTDVRPAYDVVIANMRVLFGYMHNKLGIDFDGGQTIMRMIGKNIYLKFTEVLVKDCFIETIPNSIDELQLYGRITSEIQDFQQFLTMLKFFPDSKFTILEYLTNIDILFADKSSQYFLETARLLILKDLSNSMSIGVESIPEDTDSNDNRIDEASEEALKILDNTIPQSLFYFPRCMISKSAQELLDLVHMMMEQAAQCSDVVCKKLYMASRLVFELYDAVVPYHHENFLQTIPQYVALFHNNCMYLAHNLQTFGDKWLALMDGRDLDYPIGFMDLVQKLRDLGYKHLTVHMQQQRKQILDNIRSSDLNCIVVKDVLGDNAEQAVRQCLRQLQLLKNVWIGVFPINVFVRLMATLVNMLVEELIHRVCTVEDISAEMATQLTDIYTIVVKKAPTLFQNSTDIEDHVKSWTKLQELILILGGSLKDIEVRWKEGTGPLAVHFRTEELRSLIKALFQNTQIRANLLAKIK